MLESITKVFITRNWVMDERKREAGRVYCPSGEIYLVHEASEDSFPASDPPSWTARFSRTRRRCILRRVEKRRKQRG